MTDKAIGLLCGIYRGIRWGMAIGSHIQLTRRRAIPPIASDYGKLN
jgi:hypothetical protein